MGSGYGRVLRRRCPRDGSASGRDSASDFCTRARTPTRPRGSSSRPPHRARSCSLASSRGWPTPPTGSCFLGTELAEIAAHTLHCGRARASADEGRVTITAGLVPRMAPETVPRVDGGKLICTAGRPLTRAVSDAICDKSLATMTSTGLPAAITVSGSTTARPSAMTIELRTLDPRFP